MAQPVNPLSTFSEPTNVKLPEEIHFHWHLDNKTQIPVQFTWQAISNQFFSQTIASGASSTNSMNEHDCKLLDKARCDWQQGDWQKLTELSEEQISHHPDRAKLALLVAAGYGQQGNSMEARRFVQLARKWGCEKHLISKVLIAGVHNSLGRAAVINGNEQSALKHFEYSLEAGAPANKIRLLTQTRFKEQSDQLKLSPPSILGFSQNCLNVIGKNINEDKSVDEPDPWVTQLVNDCWAADDVLEEIDHIILQNNFDANDAFFFFVLISDRFLANNDNMTALSFLNSAREYIDNVSESQINLLVKKLIDLGQPNEATDLIFQSSLSRLSGKKLNDIDKKTLKYTFEKNQIIQNAKIQHGHEVLLTYLQQILPRLMLGLTEYTPVFVEIGSTRENVPGQGSTRKIAEFCKENGIHFITVDIDPHNTRVAAKLFSEMNTPFEAVTMKGEDYLREYDGFIDFIFLDAYDFDHGNHSDLRQSRYKRFLGAPIDDSQCHLMHLDCAKSVVEKLSKNGLVCVDDTWLENDKWTAKGTLAMPYLLENGFNLIEARNRAALLRREVSKT